MASADVQGKFLWHELVTADPSAAGAFYGKVLGWTPQAWDKDPSYTVLLTPKGPVGGMMKPDSHATGSSAQWLAYVGAASVEETAAAAQRLGGRVLKGASDIPGGGRHAVLADPQGAVFGIHTPPATGSPSHTADAFTWHELSTSDHGAALRFYRELFGWEQLAVHDMGAMGPYVIFGRGGQQLGGMFTRQGGGGAHWLSYVRVSSASKAADAAKAAGGRLINGPHQVPGGSWIAQLADPHGAAIAVNQPQAAAESAQPAKPAAKPAAAPAAAAKPAAPAPSAIATERRPPAPPAPSAPQATSAHTAPAAKPATGTSAPAGASRPAASAQPVAKPVTPSAPAVSKPAAPASAAAAPKPAAAAAPARRAAPAKAARKRTARKSAARKSAARGAGRRAGASRRKKTARPARKTAAGKKRSMKKGAAARSRRAAGGRSAKRSGGARSGARRAGSRKAARSKRARRR